MGWELVSSHALWYTCHRLGPAVTRRARIAGAVLLGLVLNAPFGWWWADPLASLVIVYYGIWEAIHALRESVENTPLTDALRGDL